MCSRRPRAIYICTKGQPAHPDVQRRGMGAHPREGERERVCVCVCVRGGDLWPRIYHSQKSISPSPSPAGGRWTARLPVMPPVCLVCVDIYVRAHLPGRIPRPPMRPARIQCEWELRVQECMCVCVCACVYVCVCVCPAADAGYIVAVAAAVEQAPARVFVASCRRDGRNRRPHTP